MKVKYYALLKKIQKMKLNYENLSTNEKIKLMELEILLENKNIRKGKRKLIAHNRSLKH